METNSFRVSEAFSKQSAHFDQLNRQNPLTDHLRKRFREEVCRWLPAMDAEILELNGGTGLDAIFFAEKGHRVLVTDNAPGMLGQLQKKISSGSLHEKIKTMQCSFHELHRLEGQKFDHIISNFGGLNCSEDLSHVLSQIAPLLRPQGKITLVIMPSICPWELVMAFKGKFHTAFRRFNKQAPANIDGVSFNCYYYNPSYVIRHLKKDFRVKTLRGIFITVPPEFFQRFVERYPRLYTTLSWLDDRIAGIYPFNRTCDHYMITLEKRE